MTGKVCHQMAEHAVLRQRNYDAAIQHYKEALTFDGNDEVCSFSFIKVYNNTELANVYNFWNMLKISTYVLFINRRLPCVLWPDYIS